MTGPYYTDADVTLWHGDCVAVMRGMEDNSVHAVVTDPPYDLTAGNGGGGFMGKKWDATGVAFDPATWAEALRVIRPGGHLLAFGGTRTHHRLACAIEDAGFEIRDSIASYGGTIPGPFATLSWVQGQGFPKSLDVGKAIDRAAGAEREVVGPNTTRHGGGIGVLHGGGIGADVGVITAPATDAARQWDGWGTALRPAHEPIVVARKPLTGTVASNVTRWGTGAINVDGCRVGDTVETWPASRSYPFGDGGPTYGSKDAATERTGVAPPGRWPSNVVLTHSASCTDRCVDGCPVRELDQQSGVSRDGSTRIQHGFRAEYVNGIGSDAGLPPAGYGGEGGSSRFFPTFRYEAKAPTLERPSYVKDGVGTGRVTGLGGKVRQCNVCETRAIASGEGEPSCGHGDYRWEQPTTDTPGRIAHPTVKPLSLMRWLVRLVTPPNGTVLDMFAGSGTTGEAALLEGFNCVLIENDPDSLPLIAERIRRGKARGHQADLFGGAA